MYHTENSARILVVEDDADILQVLCAFLKCAGFEVRGLANGQYTVIDYWIGKTVGSASATANRLPISFAGFLLLEAIPLEPART